MFYSCYCLKKVEIPDGVKYIGKYCFADSGLQEISLPCTLKKIGFGAFNDCKWLRTVWVKCGCKAKVHRYVGKNVEILWI